VLNAQISKDICQYAHESVRFIMMLAQSVKRIDPRNIFATHPVFTHGEFLAAHTAVARSPHTATVCSMPCADIPSWQSGWCSRGESRST